MLEDREGSRARRCGRPRKMRHGCSQRKEASGSIARTWKWRTIEILVALAREGDKDALEILRKYARGARARPMNVPTDLHEFVWEWFIDGPPKAKSGTSHRRTRA